MSLEKIERYIGELQALKDYDKVCEERTEALRKVGELEKQLSEERFKAGALSNESNVDSG